MEHTYSPSDLASADVLRLSPGQVLFRAGEPKRRLYEVVSGGIGLTPGSGDTGGVHGYGLPGTILGLGFLDRHLDTAQALAVTEVRSLPLSAAHQLAKDNGAWAERVSEAAEREFAQLRAEAAGQGARTALEKLAAFLVAVSSMNRSERGDPSVISDSLTSGVLAEYLGVSVAQLSDALLLLHRQGLVTPARAGGLKLLDPAGLDAVARGELRPSTSAA